MEAGQTGCLSASRMDRMLSFSMSTRLTRMELRECPRPTILDS